MSWRMRASWALTVLGLVVVLCPGRLGAKDKKTVPAVFGQARYVYVVAEDGDLFKPGLWPEDRQAISDVMEALRHWNRYVLTATRGDAELLFVVRKGRLMSATLGGTISAGTPGPTPGQTRRGVLAGGELGPPDDLLEVRAVNRNGNESVPVWERSEKDGLNGPQVPLLRELRQAVDKDYPL